MRRLLPLILLLVAFSAFAAINFPPLTGRVVDDAHILSGQTINSLSLKLEEYERGTSNQVVVATIKSLEGNDIADYGYRLGRTWQIGQKDKNNGALLIVAPSERKVRIEVGYGLEPLLTDASSSVIINSIILPRFREGNLEKGVIDGVDAMLSVLGGKGIPAYGEELSTTETIFFLIFIFLFFIFALRYPDIAYLILLNMSSHASGSRSGRGGFKGGGGSFGGGGSSGSW